jgi:hypothetical protein
LIFSTFVSDYIFNKLYNSQWQILADLSQKVIIYLKSASLAKNPPKSATASFGRNPRLLAPNPPLGVGVLGMGRHLGPPFLAVYCSYFAFFTCDLGVLLDVNCSS